jgi:hypothetical protein
MDDVLNIRTERTPNPNSLKYVVGRLLLPGGSANFPTAASAQARSPLARRIFLVPGVAGVFTGFLQATAAVAAVAVLGEQFTAVHAVGFALTGGSLALATWPGRRAR